MPQLINPIVPDLRSPAPRVPEDPVPTAAFRLGNELQDKTLAVADTLLKQQQLQQDHESLNYFIGEHAKIQNQLNDMRDPREKLNYYNEELTNLLSDTHQKFPGISVNASSDLIRMADVKRTGVNTYLIRQQEKQGKEDYQAALKTSALLAVQADSDEERKVIEDTGLQRIDFEQGIGTISKQQALFDRLKFLNDVNEARMEYLTTNEPSKVLMLSPKESGVHPEKWREYRNEAYGNIEKTYSIAGLWVEERKKQAKIDLYMGKFDPAQAEQMYRQKLITRNDYESVFNKRPSNEAYRQSVVDQLDNTKWDGPEAVDVWIHNNVSRDSDPSDYSFIIKHASDIKDKLSNEQGLMSDQLYHDLKSYTLSHDVGGFEMLSKYALPNKVAGISILQQAKKNLYHAKSFEDMGKLFESYKKQIDVIFKVGQPKPKVRKPGEAAPENVTEQIDKLLGDQEY